MTKEYNVTPPSDDDDAMLPEYDFSTQEGVRGKYYRAYREGYTVTIHHADGRTTMKQYEPDSDAIVLEPDVRAYFPDSNAVNSALRTLITLIPKKRKRTKRVSTSS
jgi:hypothetical protein